MVGRIMAPKKILIPVKKYVAQWQKVHSNVINNANQLTLR